MFMGNRMILLNFDLAPEIHEGKPYGIKADIYSLGVLLYYMLYGKFPFNFK